MSALVSKLRHAATRLDIAADFVPKDMREEFRMAARDVREARDALSKLVQADFLYDKARATYDAAVRQGGAESNEAYAAKRTLGTVSDQRDIALASARGGA